MGMINKDYKWPSTGRRRIERRNQVISQVVAVAVGLNAATYSLILLIPEGQWLALILLTLGTALTTAVVKDILDEA